MVLPTSDSSRRKLQMQKALGRLQTRFLFRPKLPLFSSISPNSSAPANLHLLPQLPVHRSPDWHTAQEVSPDVDLLVRLIREASSGWSSYGCSHLHCFVLKHGLVSDAYISSTLLHSYVGTGSVEDARKLFDEIPQSGVVLWNVLMSGCVRLGLFGRVLELFLQLERSGTRAEAYSFTAVLTACARSGRVRFGVSVHARVVKCGWDASSVVCNCLIDLYGKCGLVEEAIDIFSWMSFRDVISWNSVISACSRNDEIEQGFTFLRQMPEPDIISYNEMISGITQFGEMDEAVRLLAAIPGPNSSSWNSIITGYVNRGQAIKALDVFSKLHTDGVEKDQFTFSSILSGIACLGSLDWGCAIHCFTVKDGLDLCVVVGTALVDMYAKCGHMANAELIFRSLHCRNLVSWNAMISGFAHNGNFEEAIQLYQQLCTEGIEPDEITFLNVLSACSHCKVPLDTAMQFFKSMVNDYGIEPTVEHCCSMIRVMGQSRELWRAGKLIYRLGFGSCGSVWRALLGACGCSDLDLKVAEVAAGKVIELIGDEDYVYVALSNIYGFLGKWSDRGDLRRLMRLREVPKTAGSSWIEV